MQDITMPKLAREMQKYLHANGCNVEYFHIQENKNFPAYQRLVNVQFTDTDGKYGRVVISQCENKSWNLEMYLSNENDKPSFLLSGETPHKLWENCKLQMPDIFHLQKNRMAIGRYNSVKNNNADINHDGKYFYYLKNNNDRCNIF